MISSNVCEKVQTVIGGRGERERIYAKVQCTENRDKEGPWESNLDIGLKEKRKEGKGERLRVKQRERE